MNPAAILARLTVRVTDFLRRLGRSGVFLGITLLTIIVPPYRLYPVVRQLHFIGARSLLVIVVSGAFVGMVVALQFYDTLLRFGAVAMEGTAVGLSLVVSVPLCT